MPLHITKPIHFGAFLVTTQVFHLTPLSFAFVNLKPLLPGHVLVSPLRAAPRFADLTYAELSDLFATAQRVGRMIERVFRATSLNIAVQDGPEAGQSVPHVHAHIIPRRKADLDERGGGDAIYEMMDGEEGDVGRLQLEWERRRRRGGGEFPGADAERRSRGEGEMRREAEWLAREMEKEG